MEASAIKLYGICRELGYCVDDCGLCEKIANPDPVRRGRASSIIFDLPELEADELEMIDPPRRRGVKRCDKCGKMKYINHVCKGPHIYRVRVAKKLPKPVSAWSDIEIKMCRNCRRKLGGHYGWCDQQ